MTPVILHRRSVIRITIALTLISIRSCHPTYRHYHPERQVVEVLSIGEDYGMPSVDLVQRFLLHRSTHYFYSMEDTVHRHLMQLLLDSSDYLSITDVLEHWGPSFSWDYLL